MNEILETIFFISLGLLGLGGMLAFSLLRRPTWVAEAKELESNWTLLAWQSVLSGLILGSVAFFVALKNDWLMQSVPMALVGGYLFFQSLFTDFALRYVDRWILRVANLTAGLVGIYVLSTRGLEHDWLLYGSFAAVAFAIGLLPGIGDSDGRAFLFLILSTYPIMAIAGLQYAFLGMLACIVIYFISYSIWKGKFTFRGLMTKMSFPMVPLIIFPSVMVAIFGRFLISG